ncbi:MAG: tetratricopeptide repeat protein [Planctomycetes bacterium]|nr:tetratricopeptide repeat protein [Planctomycetota bacterium]
MRIAGYQVDGELGRGAMGVVYRGHPDAGGPPVAIKVLEAPLEAPRAAARFLREAEALATLRHPNVARYAGSGVEPELGAWLALELVHGESLQDRLQRRGPLAPREALRLVGQLALGLAHAHAQGIVHRDVKPDNVVVREDGTPVLVDFGLALDLESGHTRLTQQGAFLGTPGFWSPEQARGDLARVGPPADVYSLGATLYALLSGRPPVRGSTLTDFVDARAFESVEPLEPPGDLGEEAAALSLACLAVEVEARPSMQELAARAQALLERDPLDEVPVGRRPGLATLAGILGVIACAALLAAVGVYRLRASAARVDPLERALAAREAGDWAQVVSACSEALRASPQEVRAWRLRGQARVERGEPREAVEDLTRGLELQPEDARALAWRARAKRELELWESSLADAERALALGEEGAEVHLTAGIAAHWLRERTRALVHLDRAATANADDPLTWGYRGVTLWLEDRPQEALADLDEALRLDPGYRVARVTRAQVRAELGDTQGALDDLGEGLARDPTNRRCLEVRGGLLSDLERHAEAKADYERLAALAPEDAWPWRQLTHARASLGDFPGAYEAGKRALELDPKSGPAWTNFGYACKGLGELSEAIEAFRRALEYAPEYTGAWAELGELYLHEERYAEAIEAYGRALEAFPERSDLFNGRALARTSSGDHAGAEEDADRALALAPSVASYWLTRAMARTKLGRTADALSDYEAYLSRNPADPVGWAAQAEALELQGDLVAALRSCEEAMVRAAKLPVPVPAWWAGGVSTQRVRLLYGLGEDAAVVVESARLLEAAEHHPELLYLQARSLARLGRLEDAIRVAEHASDWERDPAAQREVQASLAEWRAAQARATGR